MWCVSAVRVVCGPCGRGHVSFADTQRIPRVANAENVRGIADYVPMPWLQQGGPGIQRFEGSWAGPPISSHPELGNMRLDIHETLQCTALHSTTLGPSRVRVQYDAVYTRDARADGYTDAKYPSPKHLAFYHPFHLYHLHQAPLYHLIGTCLYHLCFCTISSSCTTTTTSPPL